MEVPSKPEAAPKAQEESSLFSKALKVVTFPVSALLGGWTTYVSVHSSTQKTAEKNGALQGIENHGPRIENAHKRIAGDISVEDFLKKEVTNRAEYLEALEKRMEHMGLGSFSRKFNYISRNNRQKALIEGVTVAAVAIGSLFTIADSKWVSKLFSNENEKNENTR